MYSSILKETYVWLVVGRIFKTPVHRHFDGILRDAPHPLGSPTFYHAPTKISNKPAKLQKFVRNCKKDRARESVRPLPYRQGIISKTVRPA